MCHAFLSAPPAQPSPSCVCAVPAVSEAARRADATLQHLASLLQQINDMLPPAARLEPLALPPPPQ